MHPSIYTYPHTNIHTHPHTHIPRHTHSHTYTYITHTHIDRNIHQKNTHKHIKHTYIHTHTQTYIHTHIYTHIGYSFRLTARILLYASSHRQDSTYHGFCYTSHGALAETRNSSMGPPWGIDPTTHRTMSERTYHEATSRSCNIKWR